MKISTRLNQLQHQWCARHAPRVRFSADELTAQGYSSQNGQDKWVVEQLFGSRRAGVFVDVGAHDGVTFSNTVFLERELGWTGLAIEPIPEVYARLQTNRRCLCLNGCISAKTGMETFRIVTGRAEMLSGIKETYDPLHEARIAREIATYGGTQREVKVSAFTLAELLTKHSMQHVNYMSIDVEGAELTVLNSIDWQQARIDVIGIENNYRDARIPRYLAKRNYQFHSRVGDEFYIHESFHPAVK